MKIVPRKVENRPTGCRKMLQEGSGGLFGRQVGPIMPPRPLGSRIYVALGALLAALGAVLGRLGPLPGRLGLLLGPPGVLLESMLASREPLLGAVWASLGATQNIVNIV